VGNFFSAFSFVATAQKEGVFLHTSWCRKKHLLNRLPSVFYRLSHQLNQLARLFSAGITVAEWIHRNDVQDQKMIYRGDMEDTEKKTSYQISADLCELGASVVKFRVSDFD
jgi:hypothetical protein